MIKNLLSVIFIGSFFNVLSSQVTTVLDGSDVDSPNGLLLVGETLYFSESSRISKIDVTDTSTVPIRTTVISGLNNAIGMEIQDNELFFANFFNSEIVKFNLTDNTPVTTLVTNSGKPNRLLIDNDNLYYTDSTDGVLYIHDLLSINNTSQVLTSGFPSGSGALGIEIKGNNLYIVTTTVSSEGKLHRVNIDNPVPEEILSGLQRPLGIEFKGNDLYIADRDLNKIVKIDVTQNPLLIEDVVDINNPWDITFYNDIMYIATDSQLAKVDLNTLGLEEFDSNNELKLFPNPTKEYINILNLKNDKSFEVFDLNGRVLKSGNIGIKNSEIPIYDIAAGTYILRIEESNFKFIKI